MLVFISWSGAESKAMAAALREWLPIVLPDAEPWMSDVDIEIGARGLDEIAKSLQHAGAGIICATPKSIQSHWVLYEVGALAKVVDRRVCPLLRRLESSLLGPLGQFQTAPSDDPEKVLMTLQTLNRALDKPSDLTRLEKVFRKFWPELDAQLKAIPDDAALPPRPRDIEDIAEETLALVRQLVQRTRSAGPLETKARLTLANARPSLASLAKLQLELESMRRLLGLSAEEAEHIAHSFGVPDGYMPVPEIMPPPFPTLDDEKGE